MKKIHLTGFAGRLFLWFWLSLTVLLLTNFLLMHYVNSYPLLDTPTPQEVQRLGHMQEILARYDQQPRETIIQSRMSRNLLFYDAHSLQPLSKHAEHWRLPELVASSGPQVLRLSPERAAGGPFMIHSSDGDMRVVWMMPPRILPVWQRFLLDSPGWRLSFSMLLVLALSIIVARWISRPIRQLSQAAHAFGAGDLSWRLAPIKGELGQLGQDFNRMADNLQQSIAAQRRLLADVSHELRSPLTRLKLAAGLLGEQERNSYIDRIEKECEHLEHLVNQVLILSRLEGSLYEEESEERDLVAEIQNTLRDWRFQAPHVDIQYQGLSHFYTALRPRLLRHVMDNLLSNACRFATQVTVSLTLQEQGWTLYLADNGPGVPEETLEHLFKPFFRDDPARGHQGNVGLGLAIAQAAVRAQGGSLTVERSALGGLGFRLEVVTVHSETWLTTP